MTAVTPVYKAGQSAASMTSFTTVTVFFDEWSSLIKADLSGELGPFTDAECEAFGNQKDALLLGMAEAPSVSAEEMLFKALAARHVHEETRIAATLVESLAKDLEHSGLSAVAAPALNLRKQSVDPVALYTALGGTPSAGGDRAALLNTVREAVKEKGGSWFGAWLKEIAPAGVTLSAYTDAQLAALLEAASTEAVSMAE